MGCVVMSTSAKKTVTGPTDFSEFHREETARRLLQDLKIGDNYIPEYLKEPVPSPPRVLSEEEIKRWQELEEIEKEDMDWDMDPRPWDDERIRMTCREHLTGRLEILRSGVEDFLSNEEFNALPSIDKERIKFAKENYVEYSDELVIQFIESRIKNCEYENIVTAYHVLLDMYDPLFTPDFYYLSLWEGSPSYNKFELWYLFGI